MGCRDVLVATAVFIQLSTYILDYSITFAIVLGNDSEVQYCLSGRAVTPPKEVTCSRA